MKKIFKGVIIVSLVIMLAGCGQKKTSSIPTSTDPIKTCTLSSSSTLEGNAFDMNNEYRIYGTDGLVSNVTTIESVTSDSQDVLDYFQETVDAQYKAINDVYSGYDYSFKTDGNTLTITTNIDYNKMNLKQYIQDNNMQSYVNSNNQFTVDGITRIYTSIGATCK